MVCYLLSIYADKSFIAYPVKPIILSWCSMVTSDPNSGDCHSLKGCKGYNLSLPLRPSIVYVRIFLQTDCLLNEMRGNTTSIILGLIDVKNAQVRFQTYLIYIAYVMNVEDTDC